MAILAVELRWHSDLDRSTVGNLLGAMNGVKAIPRRVAGAAELRDVITPELAEDLAFKDWAPGESTATTHDCYLLQ